MIGWLVDPFERVALDTVGLWYLVATVIGLGINYTMQKLGIEMDTQIPDNWGFRLTLFATVIVAPVLEELIFRIGPDYVGVGLVGMVAVTIVWALAHGRHAFSTILNGVVFLKLVLGGFYVWAIVLHAFHNLWATVYMFWKKR